MNLFQAVLVLVAEGEKTDPVGSSPSITTCPYIFFRPFSYDYCVYGNAGGGSGIEISGGGSFQQDCNQDNLMCPDGSTVGRNPNDNCDFFACPRPGIDISTCAGACRSYEQCRDEALSLGLDLGSNEFDFAAVYPVKGCHFYADGPYANQA